ncbi:unnamed protein product [Rotaria sordida]|uniref:MAM domain-containing protein n=1 Tax=Rotaria sordida TaxID=392033 RepID=A0A813Z3Q1_9BILA|nr:unnamed protein product [Rotaria sordida]
MIKINGWFIDTSDLKSNQTARLISTMISITNRGLCFRFWYRAFGSKQGKLNLLQRISNQQNTTLIYSNYQFILEGIVGNKFTDLDNIAIDDITTNEGPCSTQKFCDFESQDICGYVHYLSGNFNWTP